MKSLLLNSEKDIEFDGSGNLKMVEALDETRQSIKVLLSTNQGEWFLDLDFGFDYSTVFVKNPDFEEIRGELIDALDDYPQVETVQEIDFDFDEAERELTIYLTIELTNGEVIEQEVTV